MVTPARIHGIDVARVEAAIRAAEQGTSAEIRVAVARFYFWGDARRAAEHAWRRLHMSRTREHNGVLIFVAPRRRQLVVLGDTGIGARVSPDFWREMVETMAAHCRRGALTDGLVDGVAHVGKMLATAFPALPGTETNQLPDAVAIDQ